MLHHYDPDLMKHVLKSVRARESCGVIDDVAPGDENSMCSRTRHHCTELMKS